VRISLAELLDALHAVSAAGLALPRMREALRAALIKDEQDSAVFEEFFGRFFRLPLADSTRQRRSRGARTGVVGGQGSDLSGMPSPERPVSAHSSAPGSAARQTDDEIREEPPVTSSDGASDLGDDGDSGENDAGEEPQSGTAAARSNETEGESDNRAAGGSRGPVSRLGQLEEVPFANYARLEYDQAREALGLLRRRWQTRLGRRLHRAARGRLDFRRTLRGSIQHGGLPLERAFRARRPRHLDLVVLADISGSVHYASLLMLELLAGAAREFRRMRGFVFIDRLAAADFEGGHLVMTPPIDLYARSDFGRVFGEFEAKYREFLNRATVVVILGDARNNRRPPRPDLLQVISRRSRAVVWLNPEPQHRWGTGDSVISVYGRVVDYVLPCGNLRELRTNILKIIR
jgi:uncharacterized protein